MRARIDLPIPPKPKHQEPHIFGRGLRDRLLMTLAAADRPVYVTELAEALGSDPSKLRKTVVALIALGILADGQCSAGARYVGLNVRHPAYPPLRRLLGALERRWPQPRFGKPRRVAERLGLRGLVLRGIRPPQNVDLLFYSGPRTRALLAVAAMGSTDVTDLIETLGLDRRSAWNVVNHWQREGVVRSVIIGRRRAVELDPAFYAAAELRRFLKRLIVIYDENLALAELSIRLPTSRRFVTER